MLRDLDIGDYIRVYAVKCNVEEDENGISGSKRIGSPRKGRVVGIYRHHVQVELAGGIKESFHPDDISRWNS